MKGKNSGFFEFYEFIKFTLLSLAIILPIRMYVAQPFIVSGQSMYPTFENGDYLIIDELSYRFNEPEKGDVVIFRYPVDPSKYFIKRIEGLPGETVEIAGQMKKLEDNEYYMLGDNRNNSSDSRVWGAVERHLIVGKAFARLWPVKSIELSPGADAALQYQY